MFLYDRQVTFSEVPDYISYTFFVAGCPMKCKGCSWEGKFSSKTEINLSEYKKILKSQVGFCEVICFLGGEWEYDIVEYLKTAKEMGFKTWLYTGRDNLPKEIMDNLNFVKLGSYQANKGGLMKETTNQKFINLDENKEVKFYGIYA
jgi:anaerobic ribonucleoside-triphosphate reductase activating protein